MGSLPSLHLAVAVIAASLEYKRSQNSTTGGRLESQDNNLKTHTLACTILEVWAEIPSCYESAYYAAYPKILDHIGSLVTPNY